MNPALAIDSSLLPNDPSEYDKLSAGEMLRQQRHKKNVTIQEVSQVLCIRQVYLNAIEQQDLSQLPEPVYTLGFVRSYARYLTLSENVLVDRFKNEVLKIQNPEQVTVDIYPKEHSSPSKKWIVFSASVIIGIFYFLYNKYYYAHYQENMPTFSAPDTLGIGDSSGKSKETPKAELPHLMGTPSPAFISTQKEQQDVEESQDVGIGDQETPASFSKTEPIVNTEIIVTATARSWIEVKDSKGKTLINKILLPQEEYKIPAEKGLILNTGNLGGLQFIIEGQKLPPLGQSGMPEHHISLTPEFLKNFRKKSSYPQSDNSESETSGISEKKLSLEESASEEDLDEMPVFEPKIYSIENQIMPSVIPSNTLTA